MSSSSGNDASNYHPQLSSEAATSVLSNAKTSVATNDHEKQFLTHSAESKNINVKNELATEIAVADSMLPVVENLEALESVRAMGPEDRHGPPPASTVDATATTCLTTPATAAGNVDATNAKYDVTATATAGEPHLPDTTSDLTFGVELRRSVQQQKIKFYHDAKQTAVWSSEATLTSSVPVKSGTVSASASPSMVRKSSDASISMPRRVSFPKSDNELVTGYLEPANPWEHACRVSSISELAELYVNSCKKHSTKPLQVILEHLKVVELVKQERQPQLSLKAISLGAGDCEALEAVFKILQYKSVDLSSCELDEVAVSALFEMFEYYEATNELDISSNAKGMTGRGWNSCAHMVRRSQALQVLNAQGNPISKTGADNLGNALSTSNLHTLKLEHCGLKGAPLNSLCFKLRHNRVLKELWLAHNDLDCGDAAAISDLLKTNHYLELVDISNNNIKDEGLRLIVLALIIQSRELDRHATFQRTEAIDDDDCFLPVDGIQAIEPETSCRKPLDTCVEGADFPSPLEEKMNAINVAMVGSEANDNCDTGNLIDLVSTNLKTAITEECDVDEDTEETVKTSTIKNPQTMGQSMLDKLLSMNSDSSSDDGASNISTDTVAPCYSEDTSITSDDIFENTTTNNKSLSTTNVSPTFSLLTSTNDYEQQQAQRDNSSDIETIPEATNHDCSSESATTSSKNNSNTNNNNCISNGQQWHKLTSEEDSTAQKTGIFEVTAEERDCLISNEDRPDSVREQTKAVDVNKNLRSGEDYDDTHSTDSAFESASEGDISRHLNDEFSRLSNSFETAHLDMPKELAIETGMIATESTECLLATSTPTPTPPPTNSLSNSMPTELDKGRPMHNISILMDQSNKEKTEKHKEPTSAPPPPATPKVTIDENCFTNKNKEGQESSSPSPTPPPPSTSPGGASVGMRRTESSCTFITQSTRNRSQSSDSLCSDNSLDGSIGSELNFSTSDPLNEKLTKNDTLTRQQRSTEPPTETLSKIPGGLKALAVWNNNLTKDSGMYIAELLADTVSLELLNIGKNCLSNEFVTRIKDSLTKNTTLTTLGLQSAHLSAKGIETLSSILTFGGNSTLQRIDIRDNKLEVESLSTLAEVLKSNTTVTQIDIDDEPKRLSVGSDAHLDYTRVLENVRSMCSRNEKTHAQMLADKSANMNAMNKRRSGYYMGSRKISLTCHSRPLIDPTATSVVPPAANSNKLDVKRKTGARLRSPVPSPPTVSPSSSPNRSRFTVFRVTEGGPLTSPQTTTASAKNLSPTSNSAAVTPQQKFTCTSLPSSSSFPSMASVTSSTQSIRRHLPLPRSRFHVSKIYEDPRVPLGNRSLPPITPPINLPPTPMAKSAPKTTLSLTSDVEDGQTNTTSHVSTKITPSALATLSPSCYVSSVSPSSSSSSTSPASITSISSSTPTTSSTSSTSSYSSTLSLSSSNKFNNPLDEDVAPPRCPIAIFNDNDNDITVTKNTVKDMFSSAMAAAVTTANAHDQAQEGQANSEEVQLTQQRARKISWFSNTGPIDKLLHLFPQTAIMQRSSSPELKTVQPNPETLLEESSLNSNPTQQPPGTVVSIRKQSPPSWSKVGTDILSAAGNSESSCVAATNAAMATLEPRSLYESATKQLRDLKQVLRQNLSFGNELSAADVNAVSTANANNTNCSEISAVTDTEATYIPTNIKKEIKENISPEHTINEETLLNMQKYNAGAEYDSESPPTTEGTSIPSTSEESENAYGGLTVTNASTGSTATAAEQP